MNRHLKVSLKVVALLAILVVVGFGGYFIYRYHEAAPPLHHKQPAFTSNQVVADRQPADTSQPAAPVSPQPTSQSTPSHKSSSTPTSHAPSHSQPQTVITSGAVSKDALSNASSDTPHPTPSATDDHQNPIKKLLGWLL